jgi:hypothetical protein
LLTFLRFTAKVPAAPHQEQRQVHPTRHCRLHLLSPAEMARCEWLRQHSLRKISMLVMQIMFDMMMDLMNKIAREAAMILKKDSRTNFDIEVRY